MDENLSRATQIAVGLWSKHWKDDMPNWSPSKDLQEVLDSIEAMSGGLERVRPVCDCGKTPQDIGRCEECGYNRRYRYEIVRSEEPH